MSEVTVVDIPTQRVVGVRSRGCYSNIGGVISQLFDYVASQEGCKVVGSPVFVCHEIIEQEALEADRKGNADIEVCLPISGDVLEKGEFKVYDLRGGKMARIVHHGAYEDCGPIYQNLFGWILEHGLIVTGPTREVYLNNPDEIEKEQILTEILAPIG